MERKRKLREDFEAIYMRFNDFKRFAHLADPAVVHDRDFERCISFIVRLYQKNARYRSFFSKSGFEEDDVRSIATIFGLTFVGRQISLGENPRDFSLMSRFIGQRMSRFLSWTARKFYIDEVIVVNAGDSPSMGDGAAHRLSRRSIEDLSAPEVEEAEPTLSDREQILELTEELDQIRDEISRTEAALVSGDITPDTFKEAKKKLSDDKSEVFQVRRVLHRREREREELNDQLTDELRRRLEEDPERYREDLCYYATTKMVSHEVRKAARAACVRYNIDYKAWLKAQTGSGRYDSAEFSY